MASQMPRRPGSKSWVRSSSEASGSAVSGPGKRVWTRAEASPSQSASQVRQPAAVPVHQRHDVNGARGNAPALPAQRPLPAAAGGALANGQLRQAGFGQAGTQAAAGGLPQPRASPQQQYVRRKPNQLTINAAARQPPALAVAAPAPARSAQRSPPNGLSTAAADAPTAATRSPQQATLLPPQARRAGPELHPREALQQQLAERAAALAGKPRPGQALPRPASAAPALYHQHSKSAAAPAVRTAKASKRWVRPEGGAAAAGGIAAGEAAAGGAASGRSGEAVHTPQRRHAGGSGLLSAPSSLLGSAFRPLLPAWARGRGGHSARGGGSPAFGSFSTLGSVRRRAVGVRAQLRRAARTWQLEGGSDGGATAAAAPPAARQPARAAKVWRRDDSTEPAAAAPAASAAAQPRPAAALGPQQLHAASTAARSAAAFAPSASATGAGTPARGRTAASGHPAARAPSRLSRQAALPGKRAGGAVKERPAKLQRIGDHMYRIGGGKGGGRTLQRQPHTPAPAVCTPTHVLQQVCIGPVCCLVSPTAEVNVRL